MALVFSFFFYFSKVFNIVHFFLCCCCCCCCWDAAVSPSQDNKQIQIQNSISNVSYLAFHKDGDDVLSLNQYNEMPLILSHIWTTSEFHNASNHDAILQYPERSSVWRAGPLIHSCCWVYKCRSGPSFTFTAATATDFQQGKPNTPQGRTIRSCSTQLWISAGGPTLLTITARMITSATISQKSSCDSQNIFFPPSPMTFKVVLLLPAAPDGRRKHTFTPSMHTHTHAHTHRKVEGGV